MSVKNSKQDMDLPMKLRRRKSDAKWRANVANCYDTLKLIIPPNKITSKRQVSKALVLQEVAKHMTFLEDILKTLLQEKAKQSNADYIKERGQAEFDLVKQDFIYKQRTKLEKVDTCCWETPQANDIGWKTNTSLMNAVHSDCLPYAEEVEIAGSFNTDSSDMCISTYYTQDQTMQPRSKLEDSRQEIERHLMAVADRRKTELNFAVNNYPSLVRKFGASSVYLTEKFEELTPLHGNLGKRSKRKKSYKPNASKMQNLHAFEADKLIITEPDYGENHDEEQEDDVVKYEEVEVAQTVEIESTNDKIYDYTSHHESRMSHDISEFFNYDGVSSTCTGLLDDGSLEQNGFNTPLKLESQMMDVPSEEQCKLLNDFVNNENDLSESKQEELQLHTAAEEPVIENITEEMTEFDENHANLKEESNLNEKNNNNFIDAGMCSTTEFVNLENQSAEKSADLQINSSPICLENKDNPTPVDDIKDGQPEKKQLVAMLLPSAVAKSVLEELPKALSAANATNTTNMPKISLIFIPNKMMKGKVDKPQKIILQKAKTKPPTKIIYIPRQEKNCQRKSKSTKLNAPKFSPEKKIISYDKKEKKNTVINPIENHVCKQQGLTKDGMNLLCNKEMSVSESSSENIDFTPRNQPNAVKAATEPTKQAHKQLNSSQQTPADRKRVYQETHNTVPTKSAKLKQDKPQCCRSLFREHGDKQERNTKPVIDSTTDSVSYDDFEGYLWFYRKMTSQLEKRQGAYLDSISDAIYKTWCSFTAEQRSTMVDLALTESTEFGSSQESELSEDLKSIPVTPISAVEDNSIPASPDFFNPGSCGSYFFKPAHHPVTAEPMIGQPMVCHADYNELGVLPFAQTWYNTPLMLPTQVLPVTPVLQGDNKFVYGLPHISTLK